MKRLFKHRLAVAVALLVALALSAVAAADVDLSAAPPSLDRGFQLLYDLEFDRAHQVFVAWQVEHPQNPMGQAAEAAGLLFSEFNRLGILESQFYADDHAFEARRELTPDATVRDRFNKVLDQAEISAQARLAKDSKDRDALFAMTLASGLRADYAALVEKRNLASLRFTRQATSWAEQLLVVDPSCYDAHLATGISQYIIGSMAAPMRWLVRLGGISGNKQAGIGELQLTADRGRYLAPFARILLAVAYVREKDKPRARALLVSLRADFPQNPLFAREIGRIDAQQ